MTRRRCALGPGRASCIEAAPCRKNARGCTVFRGLNSKYPPPVCTVTERISCKRSGPLWKHAGHRGMPRTARMLNPWKTVHAGDISHGASEPGPTRINSRARRERLVGIAPMRTPLCWARPYEASPDTQTPMPAHPCLHPGSISKHADAARRRTRSSAKPCAYALAQLRCTGASPRIPGPRPRHRPADATLA